MTKGSGIPGRRVAAVLLIGLALAGCAGTRVEGFVDPAFVGRPVASVAVAAPRAGLADRLTLEDAAVAQLSALGVRALRMVDLAPPTRNLSPAQIEGALAANRIEAVLEIAPTAEAVRLAYVPPVYGGPLFWGGGYYGRGFGIGLGGWGRPGYVAETPVAVYQAVLEQVEGGARIWTGEAEAAGGSFAGVAERVARDIALRLRADGVV
jgi:hypothetical protein